MHPASDQTIDHMRVSAHTCTGRMQSFFTYGLYAIALNCGAYSVYVCALIPFTPRGCFLHFGTHIDLRIVFFFSLLYFLVIVFFSYCIFCSDESRRIRCGAYSVYACMCALIPFTPFGCVLHFVSHRVAHYTYNCLLLIEHGYL